MAKFHMFVQIAVHFPSQIWFYGLYLVKHRSQHSIGDGILSPPLYKHHISIMVIVYFSMRVLKIWWGFCTKLHQYASIIIDCYEIYGVTINIKYRISIEKISDLFHYLFHYFGRVIFKLVFRLPVIL